VQSQVFHSKDSSSLGPVSGLSVRTTDGSVGSHRQDWGSSRCNAATSAAEAETTSISPYTSISPGFTCTDGLGVQYALDLNVAASTVSNGPAAIDRERLEELKALAKLAALRRGRILPSRVFRQTSVIRSYEVGSDGTTSINTLMSFFQVHFESR
jgi:hypothetical protein